MEVMVALPRFNTPKGEIPLGSSEVNLLGSRPPELSRKGSAGVTENPLVPNKQTNKQVWMMLAQVCYSAVHIRITKTPFM